MYYDHSFFDLEYNIMKVQGYQKELQFNGTHQLALCGNDVNSLVKTWVLTN
jgi:hypothetical protein